MLLSNRMYWTSLSPSVGLSRLYLLVIWHFLRDTYITFWFIHRLPANSHFLPFATLSTPLHVEWLPLLLPNTPTHQLSWSELVWLSYITLNQSAHQFVNSSMHYLCANLLQHTLPYMCTPSLKFFIMSMGFLFEWGRSACPSEPCDDVSSSRRGIPR